MDTILDRPKVNPNDVNIDEYISIEDEAEEYFSNSNSSSNSDSESTSTVNDRSDRDNNAAMGIIATPTAVIAFLLGQITAFFAFNIVAALSNIWPADVLLLMTTIVGFLVWYDLARIINVIISKHSNPRWVDGWRKIVSFISYILIFTAVAYGIQMLKILWMSGGVTVVQSVVVTVAGVEIFIFVYVQVSDQFFSSELIHLQKETKALLRRHKERYYGQMQNNRKSYQYGYKSVSNNNNKYNNNNNNNNMMYNPQLKQTKNILFSPAHHTPALLLESYGTEGQNNSISNETQQYSDHSFLSTFATM